MTYAEMVSLLPEKDSTVERAGRGFFSPQTSNADRKALLEFLFGEARYGQLMRLFYCGHINGNLNMKDAETADASVSIHTRYFGLFLQTAAACGIADTAFLPFVAAAAKAQKRDALYDWQAPAEQYLTKLARQDYQKVREFLRAYDPDFRLADILCRVDKDRALSDFLSLAVYGRGVNKVALRNFLRGYKQETLSFVCPLYGTLKGDDRVQAARLLLSFRNDPDVRAYLREIAAHERSKKIADMLLFERAPKHAKQTTAKNEEEVRRFFCDAMVLGTPFSAARFTGELIKPPYTAVAESLFYGVYRNDVLQNIIIVDRGRILDIENRDAVLPEDCTVKVLHPVELTRKTEFLKRLNITQPFEQIKRKVYAPGEEDTLRGACFGVAGTVTPLADFVNNMRTYGFRALTSDGGDCCRVALSRGGVLCVLDISPVDLSAKGEKTVQAKCVRFYAEKDVVRLGGKQYIEGVTPCNPAQIEARAFSEFMYAVYGLMGCR